jgi:tritrans,polycis-undecaprenyl-diphosphate synthase [geranylgeranyl-diphosphate specific]
MIPRAVGLIPDGNRRWAKENGHSVVEGHIRGADVIEDFLDWCKEKGIKTVIVYGLSEDNLHRPRKELKALFKLYEERIYKLEPKAHKNRMKVEVLSTNSRVLPLPLKEAIRKIEGATANYAKYCLKILLAWSAQKEIIQAMYKAYEVARKGLPLPDIRRFLAVKDYPDLVIRTSGESRISDFLSVQLKYAELYIIDKNFPACTRKDWDKALEWFESRGRRFGK